MLFEVDFALGMFYKCLVMDFTSGVLQVSWVCVSIVDSEVLLLLVVDFILGALLAFLSIFCMTFVVASGILSSISTLLLVRFGVSCEFCIGCP